MMWLCVYQILQNMAAGDDECIIFTFLLWHLSYFLSRYLIPHSYADHINAADDGAN